MNANQNENSPGGQCRRGCESSCWNERYTIRGLETVSLSEPCPSMPYEHAPAHERAPTTPAGIPLRSKLRLSSVCLFMVRTPIVSPTRRRVAEKIAPTLWPSRTNVTTSQLANRSQLAPLLAHRALTPADSPVASDRRGAPPPSQHPPTAYGATDDTALRAMLRACANEASVSPAYLALSSD
jgi:hypothetical protein